jgi:hypothetical protein
MLNRGSMIKRFFRWLLNKNELEAIRREIATLTILIATEIARQQPKKTHPLGPLGPVKNR